jgi:hypothetical protein
MSIVYSLAILCAIGMVGRDDDQLAKRLSEAETRRIEAALQGQVQRQLQFQVQGQLQFQVQGLGQAQIDLVIVEMRRTAEQQVQETRRARIAEAKTRSAVEILSGSIIGDSFRSSRRRASLP